jgi:hypothetical protein
MTRDQFLDIVASIDATAEIDARPAIAGGREHPHVTVRYEGKSRSWERPTYRQCFAEAVSWLEGVAR